MLKQGFQTIFLNYRYPVPFFYFLFSLVVGVNFLPSLEVAFLPNASYLLLVANTSFVAKWTGFGSRRQPGLIR